MKAIAFYLPQFHEVERNNQWWGEGYTEWTGVKEARPLYPGHYQPTEPLRDNYYDLTNPETLKWQAELAGKNGIYGFCFYHYWFSRELILEKPAELLLKHREIDTHFCFSWANETWKRTWSREEGNSWNVVYDEGLSKKDRSESILLRQEYGDWEEWKDHFMYLLPFFQDERYIKIDNKPVFLLYKPGNIKSLNSMLRMWNRLAVQYGFNGVYIIATNEFNIRNRYIDASVVFEPAYSIIHKGRFKCLMDNYVYRAREKGKKLPRFSSYQYAWNQLLRRELPEKTFLGGFVKFDKTPREGRNALVYLGATPKRFKKYFRKLVRKGNKRNHEFVFLNAWNEWGEGAYLEPDKKYGMKYLNAVKEIMESVGGCL